MATNLKIQIGDKNNIELTPVTGSTNSHLTFRLSHNLLAWSDGRFELDSIGFPVNNDVHQNVIDEKISHVEITGPTSILTTFRNLVLLKDEVKNIGANAQNEFNFELIIDKDLNNQSDHWNITDESAPGAKDQVLKLSVADFGGQLDESKIIINDTEYPGGIYTTINRVEDRSSQKDALLHLEGLLKSLPDKYGVKYSMDPNLNELDIKKGPDANFVDPSVELGNEPSATNPVPRTGLLAYSHGAAFGVTMEAENTKHILFDLKDGNHNSIYRDAIEAWLVYLKEAKIFLNIGLKKKSEVAIAFKKHGGGHKNSGENELLKEPGFYKGFPLVDPNLQAIPDPADGNKFKVSKIYPDKPVRYTKENIDNLRNFATGYTGSNSDLFTKEMIIKDEEGNDVQVYANRLPEELFGFQPGDIYEDGGGYWYYNGDWGFSGTSKIQLDILSAQSAEEAMDLAFFGKDYQEPLSNFNADNRKGNPANLYSEKHPNLNLQFNEVKVWTRSAHLERYYESLKDHTNCEWTNPGDATGMGATPAEKYQDASGNKTATGKEIDKNYDLAKEFITDYENYININITSLNKAQLEGIKSKLEKWKTTRFYTSGGAWVPVINNFLAEVDGALSLLNDDFDDDVPAWQTELAGLKNRGSELAKRIFQNCHPDQDGFTETVFRELKKLVKLLEQAHGTKTANTKPELEKFISDSENDTEKRKALEITKKVKYQDSDNKNCVETALKKLKDLQDINLEKAHQKLKSLLAGLKIGDKDAYQEIVADLQNSETGLNKVIKIWQKCQEADVASNDDNGELLNALNNLKNDTSNTQAWEAVNKYKRDSRGYADEMLKKLNDWTELRKKGYQSIKNAKNKAEFQAAKVEFMKNHEYKNDKEDYEKIYFPLLEKVAEIRENKTSVRQEEKELVNLIIVRLSDYNDWKNQLTELEDKLNKLKNYCQGGQKHNIIENYSATQKEALEKLAHKMAVKVQEWKREKAKSSNTSQENPPWYRTPLGIIGGIIMAVLLTAGVIFYFVRPKKPTKEE